MKIRVLFTISIFILSGCGTTAGGMKFDELSSDRLKSNEGGILVVYREGRITGSGDRMNIFVNGKNEGALKPVGYKVLSVPKGKVVVHTDTSGIDRRTALEIESGDTVYLKTKFSNYVVTGAWDLIIVAEPEAQKKLVHLRESLP